MFSTGEVHILSRKLILLCSVCIAVGCSSDKELTTDPCVKNNLNCTQPKTEVDIISGNEDSITESLDGKNNDLGPIKIKSVRYGEEALVEFIITNPKLIPLQDFTLAIIPENPAYEIIAGTDMSQCSHDETLFYKQKCSVMIKFKPEKIPPDKTDLEFSFKTLLGEDFKFKTSFSPSVLLADFYISKEQQALPSSPIVHTPDGSNPAQPIISADISVENTSSKDNEDITIAQIGFISGPCTLIDGSPNKCAVGTVLSSDSGNSCQFRYEYLPTDEGPQQCILQIVGSDGTYRSYSFAGTALTLESDHKSLDFGTHPVSASPIKQVLKISNPSQNQAASICTHSIEPAGSPFSFLPAPSPNYPANTSKILEVTHTPTASAQNHQSALVIDCNQRGGRIEIPLLASTSNNILISDKNRIDFGNIGVGSTALESVLFTNTSNSEVIENFQNILQEVLPHFKVKNTNCTDTLPPQTSCSVSISFTPTDLALVQTSLVVTGENSAQKNLTVFITVTGKGASLVSYPTAFDFGTVYSQFDRPGTPILVNNLMKTSAEGCVMNLSSLKNSGFSIDSTSSCLGKKSFLPGESCELHPRFTAKKPEGHYSTSIKFYCERGGHLEIPLFAHISNPQSLVLLPPQKIDWTDYLVGSEHQAIFQYLNQGTTDITDLNIFNTATSPWSLGANTCSNNLAAGATCSYTLKYNPTSSDLTIRNGKATANATNNNSIEATFTAQAKKIQASTDRLSLGSIPTGKASSALERIYFYNSSGSDIATGCSLSTPSQFTLQNNDCNGSIAKKSQCSVLVSVPSLATSQNLQEVLSMTCAVGGRASVEISASVQKPATLAWVGNGDFSFVDIGQNKQLDLTLQHNGGVQDLSAKNISLLLEDLASTSSFSILSHNCPQELKPTESCQVSVQFRPTTEAAQSATFKAKYDNTEFAILNLLGKGVDPNRRIIASKENIQIFGVLVGATQSETVNISNNATSGNSGAIQVSSLLAPWSRDGGCAGTDLNPGSHCTVEVSFIPTQVGNFEQNLEISTNTIRENINLKATAVKIFSASAEYNFGSVALTKDRTATLKFTNPSGLNDAVGCSLTLNSPFTVERNTCGTEFSKNTSCEVDVKFSAPAISSDFSQPITLTCAIGGVASILLKAKSRDIPNVILSGDNDFGIHDIASGPITKTFTISNDDAAPVSIASMNLRGAQDFSIVSNNCPTPLGAGASCKVDILYVPSEGAQTAELVVKVEDAANSRTGEVSSSLHGSGSSANLTFEPGNLAFGPLKENSGTQETKKLTITNSGTRTAVLNISSNIGLVTLGNECAEIPPNASCKMTLMATPNTTAGVSLGKILFNENFNGQTINPKEVLVEVMTWQNPLLTIKDNRQQLTFTSNNILSTDITGDPDDIHNIADLNPASRSAVFTIKNNKSYAFALENLSVQLNQNTGSSPHMRIGNDGCSGMDLPALAECTIEIVYSPLAIREPVSDYKLSIGAANAWDSLSQSIDVLQIVGKSYKQATLELSAVDPAGTPITPLPTELDFDLINATTTKVSVQKFILQNTGDLSAKNLDFIFSGDQAAFKALPETTNGCGVDLAGVASTSNTCEFKIQFYPNSVALVTRQNFSIKSDQARLDNVLSAKGASHLKWEGINDAGYRYGREPEAASDDNFYYIASKASLSADPNTNHLSLQVCEKNLITQNIKTETCHNYFLSNGFSHFAGSFNGYKLNLKLSASKILMAVSNEENSPGENSSISSLVVCDKPTSSSSFNTYSDCKVINIHEAANETSKNNGSFTSLALSDTKLVSAAQHSDGYSMTVCDFDDNASPENFISNCKSKFMNGLGAKQAEYTDVAIQGHQIIMAAHKRGSPAVQGLYAISCVIEFNNFLNCGDYSLIDGNTLDYGSDNTMVSGAHPDIEFAGKHILIASQQGAEKSKALRLAKCSTASNQLACTNIEVTRTGESSTEGAGSYPNLHIVKSDNTYTAWIQAPALSDYSNLINSSKKLSYYSCKENSLTCEKYFSDTLGAQVAVYSRSSTWNSLKNIFTTPFTVKTGPATKTGILTIGILTDL